MKLQRSAGIGDGRRLRLLSRMAISTGIPLCLALAGPIAGCDVWRPAAPTPSESARGLVVLYPGSTNSYTEMAGIYSGFRSAGIDQAIQIVPWGYPFERFVAVPGLSERLRERANLEARRIAAYQAEHPGACTTLLGYSGGAYFAILVAEELPPGTSVHSVILLSPGVSRTYDLQHMLEHVSGGVTVYYSGRDGFEELLSSTVGTADGTSEQAAAVTGFAASDPRLAQVPWSPSFVNLGNFGGHFDYLGGTGWVREVVAKWACTP